MSMNFGAINTNVDALFALNAMGGTASQINNLQQQLSTGLSINSPANNPAGYTIAQGFTTQINGTNQAISNANQAVSLIQTANGAIGQQLNILQNMRTLAVQAANGTNTPTDLQGLQQTVSQLQAQVTTIAQQTQFNGINLLDGSFSGAQFQVGANQGQIINLGIGNTQATNLGVYQSSAVSGGAYAGTLGSTTGTDSYTISSGSGNFVANGAVSIYGFQGSGTVNASGTATESAATIAASVNAITSQTGVSAQANTSVAFNVTTTGSVEFTLGNGGTGSSATNTVNISANITAANGTGLSSLVQAINNDTAQTGITASVNSNNQLVLTQSQGHNVSISGFSGTAAMASDNGGLTLSASGTTSALVQGMVTFQSTEGFSLSGGSNIGLGSSSTLDQLSTVNVLNQQSASQAITVISFAINQLNQQGSQLGATQQRVQATLGNLQTTAVNDQAAQSVIQDANIPQVSTQLTQAQILQQAGVAALAASSQSQQAYLKLLP